MLVLNELNHDETEHMKAHVARWKNYWENNPRLESVEKAEWLKKEISLKPWFTRFPSIFVPCSGCFVDFKYLRSIGFITACEIHFHPIQLFIKNNDITPVIKRYADYDLYLDENLKIYHADYFSLPTLRPTPSIIYDSGALLCFAQKLRPFFIKKLFNVSPNPKVIYVLGHEYTPATIPVAKKFNISQVQLYFLYGKNYNVSICYTRKVKNVPERLRLMGVQDIQETMYLLLSDE